MTAFALLIIRLIIATIAGVFMLRFFYPKAGPPEIIGFVAFLVGLAYILEALRRKKK